jgi:hypothetical protein
VELAQLLIDEARRLDTGGRTQFHFQAPLQSIDLDRHVATFGSAEGGVTEVRTISTDVCRLWLPYPFMLICSPACLTLRA